MKVIKEKEMTLKKVISVNRKRGLSKTEATKQAKIYMLGYNLHLYILRLLMIQLNLII